MRPNHQQQTDFNRPFLPLCDAGQGKL